MAGANQKIPITDPGIDKENDSSYNHHSIRKIERPYKLVFNIKHTINFLKLGS